jgi:hypothetical protein
MTSFFTLGSSSQPITTIFDSDFRFQKFIVFVVDFIHIIYDKIIDAAVRETKPDINDELSIFSFAIIIDSMSIGVVSYENEKQKFLSLFNLKFSYF